MEEAGPILLAHVLTGRFVVSLLNSECSALLRRSTVGSRGLYGSYLFSKESTTLPLVDFQTGPPDLSVTAQAGPGNRIPVDPGWLPPPGLSLLEWVWRLAIW